MAQPVASTSALSAAPRPSTSARRLPPAWGQPSGSSSYKARHRIDKTSSSDVEVIDGGSGTFGARRTSDEHARARKRPRTSVKGKERAWPEQSRSSSTVRLDERGCQGASRSSSRSSERGPPPPQRAEARPQPSRVATSTSEAANKSTSGDSSDLDMPALGPSSVASWSGPPSSVVARPAAALSVSSAESVSRADPPSVPTVPIASVPPDHRLLSASSTSTSSGNAPASLPPRKEHAASPSDASHLASSPGPASTPARSRALLQPPSRHAASSTSGSRPSASTLAPSSTATVARPARPRYIEPQRGPAPLELLFDGEDVKPGAVRAAAPPVPPVPALPPAPTPAPPPVQELSKPVPLVPLSSQHEVSEEARRKREAAEAEERRQRSAWAATAQVCARVHPSLAAQKSGREGEAARVEEKNELEALFSPPASPRSSSPADPVQRVSKSPPSRTASPELYTGVDTCSARKPRPGPAPPAPPHGQLPPSRCTKRDLRPHSHSSPRGDGYGGSPSADDAAGGAGPPLHEVRGSPELVAGVSARKEGALPQSVQGRRQGQGERTSKQVQVKRAAGTKKGKGKKKRKSTRPWMTLEPEDTWWTRSLDAERDSAAHVQASRLAPDRAVARAVDGGAGSARTLELTIYEVVLPASAMQPSTVDSGECWVDLHISLVRTHDTSSVILCEHHAATSLVRQASDSFRTALRSLRLDDARPFVLEADPATLARQRGNLSLSVTMTLGQVQLHARQDLVVTSPFSPFSGLVPFRQSSAAGTSASSRNGITPPSAIGPMPGIVILLAAQPLPLVAPPSPTSVVSLLSSRLERLALDRRRPSGLWIPDAIAVRSPAVSVPQEMRMPELQAGRERPGFDFLTKVPYAPGDPVRLFVHDTVETTQAAVWSKDEEISRSSMSPAEKLLARMQMRWCLLNPYPPTVYHRERSCWVHYAPLIAHFALRPTLVLHLVQHLLAHKLVTQPQLREIVRAVDREVERVEEGGRDGYDEWRRKATS